MATARKDTRKIWLIPHPTSQFKEDVKELAARHRLKIIDAIFAARIDPARIAEDAPPLTSRFKQQLDLAEAALEADKAAKAKK